MNQTEKNIVKEITFGIKGIKEVNEPLKKVYPGLLLRKNIIARVLVNIIVDKVKSAINDDTADKQTVELNLDIDLNELMCEFWKMDGDTAVSLFFDDGASEDADVALSFAMYHNIMSKKELRLTVNTIRQINDRVRKSTKLDDSGIGVIKIGRLSDHELREVAKYAERNVGSELLGDGITFEFIEIDTVSGTNLILDENRAVVGCEGYNTFKVDVKLG